MNLITIFQFQRLEIWWRHQNPVSLKPVGEGGVPLHHGSSWCPLATHSIIPISVAITTWWSLPFVCLCQSFENTSHIGLRLFPTTVSPPCNQLHQQWHYSQTRLYSKTLRIRILAYLFGKTRSNPVTMPTELASYSQLIWFCINGICVWRYHMQIQRLPSPEYFRWKKSYYRWLKRKFHLRMSFLWAFSFYKRNVYSGGLFWGSSPWCIWCCRFGTVMRQPIMAGNTQQAAHLVVAQTQGEKEEWYNLFRQDIPNIRQPLTRPHLISLWAQWE